MASIRCWQVDAFTDRPFAGNPAAVCYLESERDSKWMQSVAAEMNLSETAFVRPLAAGFELRWFTPLVEVELCGHATLATAHALWSAHLAPLDAPLEFHTKSGALICSRIDTQIELDLPAIPVTGAPPPEGLLESLDVEPADIGKTPSKYIVAVATADELRALRPDFERLRQVQTRGVAVTAPSDDPRFDFISRYFAPAVGVNEDPVTGSAHCSLGPYWSARLQKTALRAFQASARTGILSVRVQGNRVVLGGQAVTVWKGELL